MPWVVARRAGWSVVQWPEGEAHPTARVLGPLPAPEAQTAPAAKWHAAIVSHEMRNSQGKTLIDCKQVVDTLAVDPKTTMGKATFHAGVVKRMMALGGGTLEQTIATKVKAHQNAEALEGKAQWEAMGNDAADEAAKAGARLHAQLPTAMLTTMAQNVRETLKAMALLLPMWPKPGLELCAAANEERARKRQSKQEGDKLEKEDKT